VSGHPLEVYVAPAQSPQRVISKTTFCGSKKVVGWQLEAAKAALGFAPQTRLRASLDDIARDGRSREEPHLNAVLVPSCSKDAASGLFEPRSIARFALIGDATANITVF